MNTCCGYSFSSSAETAVNEASKDIKAPKLIIYFSKVSFFKDVTALLKQKFPNSTIIGGTSCGEISKDGINDGLSLIAFGENIECKTMIMENISGAPITYIEKLKEFKKGFNTQNTIVFEMTDGLSNSEEKSIAVLNSVFEDDNIPIVGGSTADDLSFTRTFISYNGEIYSNVTIVTMLHNNNGKIRVYKENIYEPTEREFVVTKANPHERKIYELDGKPVIDVYANSLKISRNDIAKYFMSNPIGKIIGDETFISSFKKIEDDGSLSLYARIYQNSYVNILKPKDPMKVLTNTINKAKKEIPKISGSIVVNCIFRTLLFKNTNFTNKFTNKLQDLGEFAGITTYGEQLNNKHLNQTMVLICFE
ncbi:FIST C-terminal domain-containing protein [Clostridium felsineum]|uniref:FIST signal transduction protein n=1 Tax=Clostridium felsineum TaxID=36839 RepID=UPI00098C0604|nr:FIST N-terminal domain-containing protein [Clostridium felsineum]MCR3760907.1 FIST C-terminal domain-containing protein [Clostridium felsineum]URZ04405.1 hypothetical protein CLAUR_044940 [Clostridium felsineum]